MILSLKFSPSFNMKRTLIGNINKFSLILSLMLSRVLSLVASFSVVMIIFGDGIASKVSVIRCRSLALKR